MLSEEQKYQIISNIKQLEEQIISLHMMLENETSIDYRTSSKIESEIDSILLKIDNLKNEIYFS